MHYIIDGYNLLFFLTDEVNPIETTRQELIDSLTSDLENLKIHATLVFDSGTTHQTHFPHTHSQSSVEIVFSSHGICADAYILEILENVQNPKDTTIVTSDRLLSQHCKERLTKTQTVPNFLKFLRKRHHKKSPHHEKPGRTDSAYNEHLKKVFEDRLDEM